MVKYVYDGDHVIAEYDDSGLLRKYIYGARVDEPVCMLENPASDGIDVADNNKAYYYHFDGLGSVVALSNSNGDSCQSYEYSVYGQVAAEDPNHPNPYMFTGRRFDIETGLYYYRARYYNPHIGRFMQTDPVGYNDGMNWYAYCGNNPVGLVDPSGMLIPGWNKRTWFGFLPLTHEKAKGKLTFARFDRYGNYVKTEEQFDSLGAWYKWAKDNPDFDYWRMGSDITDRIGYHLAGGDDDLFWHTQTLLALGFSDNTMRLIEEGGVTIDTSKSDRYSSETKTVFWDPTENFVYNKEGDDRRNWHECPSLVVLAHELNHAYTDVHCGMWPWTTDEELLELENMAVTAENAIRWSFVTKVPGAKVLPRPGYDFRLRLPRLPRGVSPLAYYWAWYWNKFGG